MRFSLFIKKKKEIYSPRSKCKFQNNSDFSITGLDLDPLAKYDYGASSESRGWSTSACESSADGNKDAVRATRGRYCTARAVRARSGYGLRRSAESCVFITEINGVHLHFCIARTAFGENSLRAYVAKERERDIMTVSCIRTHVCIWYAIYGSMFVIMVQSVFQTV